MLLNLSLSSIALVFMLIWLRQGLGLHTSAGTLGTAVGQAAVGWPPLPRPVGGIRDSNAQTTRNDSQSQFSFPFAVSLSAHSHIGWPTNTRTCLVNFSSGGRVTPRLGASDERTLAPGVTTEHAGHPFRTPGLVQVQASSLPEHDRARHR
jgi:hypothetical protein